MTCQPTENGRALKVCGGLQTLMRMLKSEGFPWLQAGPGPHCGENAGAVRLPVRGRICQELQRGQPAAEGVHGRHWCALLLLSPVLSLSWSNSYAHSHWIWPQAEPWQSKIGFQGTTTLAEMQTALRLQAMQENMCVVQPSLVPSLLTGLLALPAGRFGFQKDMNALKSLRTPHAEENMDAVSLLNATQEIVDRFKIVWRWWRVWREDVRAGWVTIGRFKVSSRPGAK